MQKKWMIAGAVVLVAAGAMPWVVGYATEQQWQLVTQEVNQRQPLFQLATDEYQRGYLNSRFHGLITITNPDTGESEVVGYRGNVTHGVTGSLVDLEPADGWQPEGAAWFSDARHPSLTVETRLWGTATIRLEVPEMDVASPDTEETLKTSGGHVTVELSDAGNHAEAQVDWPSLVATGPKGVLKVSGIHLEQRMDHLVGDIWTGSGDMGMEALSLTLPSGGELAVKELNMEAATTANDDGSRINSRLDLGIDSVGVLGESYGPHKLVVSLDNLEADSWNAFGKTMSGLQNLAGDQYASPQAQFEQQMMVMQQISTAMRNLAASGFSIGISTLEVATPEGEISGHMEIRHPELSEQEKANMLMVMHQLTGELNLSMPMALAEDYPDIRMQVAPLIKQGVLVQEGDRLAVKATMKDLMVNVNGQEFPLPPLF
ncbi:DUF945 domain-containing protein [Marinobacter salinexigens]|uniref:DUF945 domain-containing protein n=1 Tax=Marinobacter salinexigens TaxID=2919747 RepID=A0A5B0VP21_9GAMM|nr:DUF945 family protein [Marinobacter salinexigens]KAA1175589.1 DUF945 domain-containing protein [Marinobacter salinexigens]